MILFPGEPFSRKALLEVVRAEVSAKRAEHDRAHLLLKKASEALEEAVKREKVLAFEVDVLEYSEELKALLRKLDTCPEGQKGYQLFLKDLATRNRYGRFSHYSWSQKARDAQQFLLSLEGK